MDRLTLLAAQGASISDASGGTRDVVAIRDSHSVALSGFTINAGADGVSGASGVICRDNSVCRLTGNVFQGAADNAGLVVGEQSQAVVDGDTFQNNGRGLVVVSGGMVRGQGFAARANGEGVLLARGVFANLIGGSIEGNADSGVRALGNPP
jgi:uncharacterized protein with beta-barrel porin domain